MRLTKREEPKKIKSIKEENYYELVNLYNSLDSQQRGEFCQRLEKVVKKPVFPQQIEKCLSDLTSDNRDELSVYAKLLLVS